DLAGDRRADLLELLVVVLVRDRFHDLEAAFLEVFADDLDAGDPELGIEPVEEHGYGLGALCLDGDGHAAQRGEAGQRAHGEIASRNCHTFSSQNQTSSNGRFGRAAWWTGH